MLLVYLTTATGALAVSAYAYWHVVEGFLRKKIIKALEKETGVRVEVDKVFVRPRAGLVGLEGLRICALPGDWSSPYFLTAEKLVCTTTGPLGTLSLAGPKVLPLKTHVPFILGFRGKMIETLTVEGATVVVEEKDDKKNNPMAAAGARAKAKAAARRRDVLERELRWRMSWQARSGDDEAAKKTEAKLERLEQASDPDLALALGYGDAEERESEHQGFVEAAHEHLASSEPAATFAERRASVAAAVKKRLAERRASAANTELEAEMKETYARLRPADADQLMHVGRCVVDRCSVTLKGRKVRLDHPVTVVAFSGTFGDFRRLVVKRVLKQGIADSVQHKREKVREHAKEKAGERVEWAKEKASELKARVAEGAARRREFAKGLFGGTRA
eukprot:CAMPEP_0119278216 /NCGR_PEP_ID=MMETSP1329-20130426/18695_1 /TAXON_ID=114041 /ORGANISM="Genus nov. species nov., Strain RCC1024" /LENGTH=389 /DNA_ID=CAMNT_0007278719 /DNA_START=198 /DNA_END=1363 /DNA_ORIENTATION=+